jgi:hypothetical protein
MTVNAKASQKINNGPQNTKQKTNLSTKTVTVCIHKYKQDLGELMRS